MDEFGNGNPMKSAFQATGVELEYAKSLGIINPDFGFNISDDFLFTEDKFINNQMEIVPQYLDSESRSIEPVMMNQIPQIGFSTMNNDDNSANIEANLDMNDIDVVDLNDIQYDGVVNPTATNLKAKRKQSGLKELSAHVAAILKSKKEASYQDLVNALIVSLPPSAGSRNEDNVQRRLYNTINVFKALGMVEDHRDKQNVIVWIGQPKTLKDQIDEVSEKMAIEKDLLFSMENQKFELELQLLLLDALMYMNQNNIKLASRINPLMEDELPVKFPFVILKGQKYSSMDLQMTPDRKNASLRCGSDVDLIFDMDILACLQIFDVLSEEILNDLIQVRSPVFIEKFFKLKEINKINASQTQNSSIKNQEQLEQFSEEDFKNILPKL
eukprot:TRINITY_DN2064_c0_g1_i1.p1 TRINITY_DN2064_c0_g1~~TRINITY_DN2064_c0_g1_i1.p1  ORF type:complete len:385 (+),score=98.84 TRINITY_DN2064_c0_g1_i1:124-1278(+)